MDDHGGGAAETAARAERRLTWHKPVSALEWMARLESLPEARLPVDEYGVGGAPDVLARETAAHLGKPAARFVPKGMIAQMAALRAWSATCGPQVVLHPRSHIAFDEMDALVELHPLRAIYVGASEDCVRLRDLERLELSGGVLVLELPTRRAGFALPDWNEYVACIAWARSRGMKVHLDGARLWEAAPFLGRSPAEIAAQADSVYVSFYKSLGGMAGAALAGEADFLASCEPWLTRHGAYTYRTFPIALSALWGLRANLPRLPGWCGRAAALGPALAQIPGVALHPAGVNANAFQLRFEASAEALRAAHERLRMEAGVRLFNIIGATDGGRAWSEIHLMDAAEDFSDDEVLQLVAELVKMARG